MFTQNIYTKDFIPKLWNVCYFYKSPCLPPITSYCLIIIKYTWKNSSTQSYPHQETTRNIWVFTNMARPFLPPIPRHRQFCHDIHRQQKLLEKIEAESKVFWQRYSPPEKVTVFRPWKFHGWKMNVLLLFFSFSGDMSIFGGGVGG